MYHRLHVSCIQLLLEQDKQRRLSSGENRELEEAQAQVQQLQNELKIRMKLNQLQSTKVSLDIRVTCL